MLVTTVHKVSLVLLIIFHLYSLVPVGRHNNPAIRNEVSKAMRRLPEDILLEPESQQEDDKPKFLKEDDKSESLKEGDKSESLKEDGKSESLKEDDKSEEILSHIMYHLTPALMEEARWVLNETEEVKQKSLAELRRMIEAEENLVSPTHDAYLLAFLRKHNFDVAKAFGRVRDYWIFRSDYEDIFANVDMERVLSFVRKNSFGPLEYRDREGCAVFVLKVGMWDPDEVLFEDLFLAGTGMSLWSLEYEATQIAGYRIIYDLREFGWKQLRFFAPSWLMVFIRGLLYTSPARYRRIHILGDGRTIKFLWRIAYPFLPEELKRLLSFDGLDLEPLKHFIHPSVLPEEYGGIAPHFANDMDTVKQNFHKLVRLLDYGYKN